MTMKEHLAHHGRHLGVCLGAIGVLVLGIVLDIPALAIVGGIACALSCAWMVRMMIIAPRAH